MRLVVAVLRPSQVESVRRALDGVSVTRMTICDGQGWEADGTLVQQAVIEIAVNDDFLDRALVAIGGVLEAAGEPAACRVVAVPIDEAVQLYREVRGPEAV
jgi:nitrogen regulatory protein PII